MANIYSLDDDDSDLFEETTDTEHTLDGTMCPKCNSIHNVKIEDGAPDEVRRKLHQFLDAIPANERDREILVTSKLRVVESLLGDFVSFAKNMENINPLGPAVRAVAEVLDEMTEGAVTKRWKVYQVEQQLLTAHIMLTSVRNFTSSIPDEDTNSNGIRQLLLFLNNMLAEKMGDMVDRYRIMTEEVGMKADEQLITIGEFSAKDDSFIAGIMGNIFTNEISSHVESKMNEAPLEED